MHLLASMVLEEVSPFIVPVAGCAMVLGIVIAGVWSSARSREIQSQERLAAIAKGIPIPPTVEELALMHGKPSSSLVRRKANIRLTGIILTASGLGLIAFFVMLAAVLRERDVLCGAAAALIPLGMGAGFLYDARLEHRELEEAKLEAPSTPYTPGL